MLDTFFRKYAWIANAVLLVAAAWLCARTVNTVVAASIRPRPQVDLSALPAGPPGPAVQQPLTVERLYPLFNVQPPKAEEAVAAKAAPKVPQNCFDRRAAPVRSSIRAQLVAAVLSGRPEGSIGTLTRSATRETRIYGVGERFQAATLLGVDRVRDPRDATGAGFRVVAVQPFDLFPQTAHVETVADLRCNPVITQQTINA